MVRTPTEVAALQRARWLGELSDALDAAQRLLWQLDVDAFRPDIIDLASRLEAARAQVRSMRIVSQGRSEFYPEWINPSLWQPIDIAD